MKTFSANSLAEHFEVGRRTMILCLRSVPPDAELTEGRPTWKISTAARALEAHRRKMNGGNGGHGGIDPTLQALYDEHFAAEVRMRALPTLASRREAASAMLPLILEMDKATRRIGIASGQDSDHVHLRADQMLRLYARGIEGPCEMTHDEVWTMMFAEAEDA
jgi:hypothetical protein